MRRVNNRTIEELYHLMANPEKERPLDNIDKDIEYAIKEDLPLPCIVFENIVIPHEYASFSRKIRLLSGENVLNTAFALYKHNWKYGSYRLVTQEYDEETDKETIQKLMKK